MVFFVCDGCGESLKKNAVAKHRFRCRNSFVVSCVDCSKTFRGEEYNEHTKCITEHQKYAGASMTQAKGEAKQEAWAEQVQKAIDALTETSQHSDLIALLQRIREYPNIPRKEKPFLRFISNSVRGFTLRQAENAWTAISTAAKKSENEKPGKLENGKSAEPSLEPPIKKMKTEKSNEVTEELEDTKQEQINFKWKESIKSTLRNAENNKLEMKKLRKRVIKKYKMAFPEEKDTDNNLQEIFDDKVTKISKIKVDGKFATIS